MSQATPSDFQACYFIMDFFSDMIFLLDHGGVEVRVVVVGEDGVLVSPRINQSFHFVEDWDAWTNPMNNPHQSIKQSTIISTFTLLLGPTL